MKMKLQAINLDNHQVDHMKNNAILSWGPRKGKLFKQDDDVTKKVRLKIAKFFGKLNPTAFLHWIMLMENYFDWYVSMWKEKLNIPPFIILITFPFTYR